MAQSDAGRLLAAFTLVLAGCGQPAPADTQPPSVTLSAGAAQVTQAGPLRLSAEASDNVGVVAVEFFEGARSLGRLERAPYVLDLSLGSADNGPHSYLARAQDAAGNTAPSRPVGVSVNIQTPVTPPPVTPPPVTPPPSGTAPQFVGASGQLFAQGTPASLALPAGTRPGDALIAILAVAGEPSNVVSAPAGLTRLGGFPLAGGGSAVVTLWVYSGVADGAASLSFGSAQPATLRAVLLAYRGADPAGLREAHGVSTSPSPAVTAPGLDAPAGSVLLRVGSVAPANHRRRLVAPAGLAPRYDIGEDARFVLAVADEPAAGGPSGARSFQVMGGADSYAEASTGLTLALPGR